MNQDNVVAIRPQQLAPNQALLNITHAAQNGTLNDPVPYDLPDGELRRIVTEAVRSGSVVGLERAEAADFTNYVFDRFPATAELPARVFARPKTPYGA